MVCRSSEYDEEEVVNAIKGLRNSGRLSKSNTVRGRKLRNRKILLLKDPCESESDTDSDSDSSDDNE